MNTNQVVTSIAFLVVASVSLAVDGQILPQSHLGRLVQSITSPLVLSSGANYGTDSDSDSYNNESPSSYYPQGGNQESPNSADSAGQPSQHQHQKLQEQQEYRQPQQYLQQAPSQQRGVPQHYYSSDNQGADRDQGSAPSNSRQTGQEYQMGAYLGPTMDDKEINGAFNGNNDDRDDDDGPASYDAANKGVNRNKAASNGAAYRNNPAVDDYGYGPSSGYAQTQGNMAAPSYGHNQGPNYDDDAADEDDAPVHSARGGARRGSGQRSYGGGLSQAASQYQQQAGAYNPERSRGPMMAAANGYAPYGYSNGPIDLSGLMAGMSGGGDPNAGYQVYNGDGSYPGANYYQQQGQRGGRNHQAASMNNGQYNNGYGPSAGQENQQQEQQSNGENDDHDNDADED